MPHYRVIQTAVGPWRQGALLTDAELAGIDTDRLVALGALARIEESVASAPVEQQDPPKQPAPRLDRMKLDDLKALAAEMGIDDEGLATRADYIGAIAAAMPKE